MPHKSKKVWRKLDLLTIETLAESSRGGSKGRYGGKWKGKGKGKANRTSQDSNRQASDIDDTVDDVAGHTVDDVAGNTVDDIADDTSEAESLVTQITLSRKEVERPAVGGDDRSFPMPHDRPRLVFERSQADNSIEARKDTIPFMEERNAVRQMPTVPTAEQCKIARLPPISTAFARPVLPSALPFTPVSPLFCSSRNSSASFEMSNTVRATSRTMINVPSREFPSLGAPLQQQSSAAQSMWSNPSLRTSSQQAQANLQRNPQSLQLQSEELSHFGNSSEGYRFGGATNQLAGLAQTPTQAQGGDDFPPLGDNEGRNTLLGAFSSGPGAGLDSRIGLGQSAEQPLRGLGDRNPTPRGRTLTNPNPFPVPETSQPLGFASSLGSIGLTSGFSNSNSLPVRSRNSQLDYSQTDSNALSPDFGQTEQHNLASTTGAPRSRQVSGPSSRLRLADMTPRQREGLLGLAARLDPEHPDFSPMALGQDLTQLGLDLNRSDSTPLFATFATPFGPANQAVRPAVPDFTLPAAYKVQNVPPLHEKIPSFSDEGLLAVFYTMPRDLAQEMAAQELYNRDWRWHMRHQVWLQKDTNYPAPTRVNMKEERGFYVVWNAPNWRKERRELTLNYDDLEQRTGPQGFN